MDTLDKHVRDHYEAAALETNQLQRIMTSSSRHSTLFRPVSGAIAAGILVLASMAVHHQTSIGERTDRTLREAAMNHSTRLDLEFMSDKIDTLNQKMALLPFTISLPDTVKSTFTIVGTRYCSINGKLAAHIKLLEHSSNNTVSLFMTSNDEDLEQLNNKQRTIDGLDVKLWRERGLFYAMARATS
jgi:hypothetical protein